MRNKGKKKYFMGKPHTRKYEESTEQCETLFIPITCYVSAVRCTLSPLWYRFLGRLHLPR